MAGSAMVEENGVSRENSSLWKSKSIYIISQKGTSDYMQWKKNMIFKTML